jgi:hypothetical protein
MPVVSQYSTISFTVDFFQAGGKVKYPLTGYATGDPLSDATKGKVTVTVYSKADLTTPLSALNAQVMNRGDTTDSTAALAKYDYYLGLADGQYVASYWLKITGQARIEVSVEFTVRHGKVQAPAP